MRLPRPQAVFRRLEAASNYTRYALHQYSYSLRYRPLLIPTRILDNISTHTLHRPVILPEFGKLAIKGSPSLLQIINIPKLCHFELIYHGSELLIENIPSPKHIQSLNMEGVKFTSHKNKEILFPELSKLRLSKIHVGCLQIFNAPKLNDLTLIDITSSRPPLIFGDPPGGKSRERQLVTDILNGQYLLSPFRLKSLTLERMLLDVHIPKFLQTQPELLTLRIVDCNLSAYFLNWLANLSEERPSIETLPVLSTIHIIRCACVLGETYSLETFVRECAIGRPSVQVGIEYL